LINVTAGNTQIYSNTFNSNNASSTPLSPSISLIQGDTYLLLASSGPYPGSTSFYDEVFAYGNTGSFTFPGVAVSDADIQVTAGVADGKFYPGTGGSQAQWFTFNNIDTVPGNNPQLSASPEPLSLALLGIGVAGVVGYSWRKRKLAAGR
jgi:hypothetical protein